MSPEQCRAARAWLDWSMDELATAANCSNSTVRDFEAGRREPHRNRLATIRQALEQAGIVFSEVENGKASIAATVKPRGAEPRTVVVEKKRTPPSRKRKPGGVRKRA